MSFLRQHLFYVILIAATLIVGAVATGFYLTSDVDERLAAREKVSNSLAGLGRRRPKMNEESVARLKERIETLRSAAKKDAADSVAFNKRSLMRIFAPGVPVADPNTAPVLRLAVGGRSIKAFPIDAKLYNDLGLYFSFIKEYGQVLDGLIARDRPRLHRTSAPTQEEIADEAIRLRDVAQERARSQAVLSMMVKKARAGWIYIEDDALDRVFPPGTTKATEAQLWQAQVNLWVTSEVVQAIMDTNLQVAGEVADRGVGEAKMTVLTSPVKRLVKLTIDESMAPAARGGGGLLGGGSGRSAVTGSPLTGRKTNAEYGVIRYRFSVVMPSRHVYRLMRNLQTQNYHTVLDTNLRAVETDSYYYGTGPVMQIEVTGEFLLLMKWVRPLLPDAVAGAVPGG